MTQKKRATQRVILSCCSEESRRTLLRPAPASSPLLTFDLRPVDADPTSWRDPNPPPHRMITINAFRCRDELFSLTPADLACYSYGMDYPQDAQHSPDLLRVSGRHQAPLKTFSDGPHLPMVEAPSQNHNRWYNVLFSCLLACLAISAPAFAASPSASPNMLPGESRGVTKAPPPQPINWDRVK